MTSIALKKFTYKSICLEKDWASVHFRKKLINLTKCPTLKIANSRVTEVSTNGLQLNAGYFHIRISIILPNSYLKCRCNSIFNYFRKWIPISWNLYLVKYITSSYRNLFFYFFSKCLIKHLILNTILPVLESSHWSMIEFSVWHKGTFD